MAAMSEKASGIIVLFGPSGVGKSTIAEELVKNCPDLWLSRSWTTRPRRPQESPDSYKFVEREEFIAHREAGGFLEWDEFLGNFYGTPVPEAPEGEDVLLEITLDGAEQVKKIHPKALLIFVDTPSQHDQKRRLRRRGDSASNIRRRLRKSKQERRRSAALRMKTVVNDDLVQTVKDITQIILDHRKS